MKLHFFPLERILGFNCFLWSVLLCVGQWETLMEEDSYHVYKNLKYIIINFAFVSHFVSHVGMSMSMLHSLLLLMHDFFLLQQHKTQAKLLSISIQFLKIAHWNLENSPLETQFLKSISLTHIISSFYHSISKCCHKAKNLLSLLIPLLFLLIFHIFWIS